MIRYSKTTGAFYPYDITYPNVPADVQDVAFADYDTVMDRAPGATFSFDATGKLTITAPAGPTLSDVKAARKSAVREYRDNLLLLTPFSGKQFQTDLASKLQISVVAGQATLPPSASQWRTADNSYMTMTLALFQQLMGTIMQREGAAFTNSAKHQDAIDALTSVAAVQAYDFSTGWPV